MAENSALATREWLLREALRECGLLIANYGEALALAAERGADKTAGIHLQQTRLSLIEAIRTFKELVPEREEND